MTLGLYNILREKMIHNTVEGGGGGGTPLFGQGM